MSALNTLEGKRALEASTEVVKESYANIAQEVLYGKVGMVIGILIVIPGIVLKKKEKNS